VLTALIAARAKYGRTSRPTRVYSNMIADLMAAYVSAGALELALQALDKLIPGAQEVRVVDNRRAPRGPDRRALVLRHRFLDVIEVPLEGSC
jgi:hypothetical protein